MNDDENRKRGHQEDVDVSISSKRAAIGSVSEDENFYFKMLCPQSITGLIIGRGGSIINHLNSTCGAKISLSQNNEFYPNTTDRILIISGNKTGLINAIQELVTRIAEAPEKKSNTNNANPVNRGPQGTYQIKILIPKIASASVIGRGGAAIKRMSEASSCKYQLGDESDPYNTKERIVSINSNSVENLINGVIALMEHIVSEPKIRIYQFLTTNYLPQSSTPPYKNINGAPQVMSPMAQMPVPGPVPMMPNMMNPTVIPMGSGPPNPYAMPPYINPYMPIPIPMQQGMQPSNQQMGYGVPINHQQYPPANSMTPIYSYQFAQDPHQQQQYTIVQQPGLMQPMMYPHMTNKK